MGRPKKSAPASIEPEFESQEIPEEEPEDEEQANEPEPGPIPQGAVSQSDAARDALDAGYEKPAEAVKYIKEKFGIDMNPQYFSAIKTRTKAALEVAPIKEKAKLGRKPKAAAPLVNGYVAPPEKPKVAGEPDVLVALEGVKELVDTYGADKIRRIVELLS